MFGLALGLFVATAALGIGLNVRYARGRGAPVWAAGAHGVAGVAAIALLGWLIATGPTVKTLNAALLVFILAAVGGLFMLVLRIARLRPPLAVIGTHGAVALVALAVFCAGAFGHA